MAKFDPKMIEAEEDLLIDFQFCLEEVLAEKGLSRSELAKRAGLSKARLSQLLSSEANPTLKTFARLFYALDEKIGIMRASPASTPLAPAVPDGWEWQAPTPSSLTTERRSLQIAALVKEAVAASSDNYYDATYVEADGKAVWAEAA